MLWIMYGLFTIHELVGKSICMYVTGRIQYGIIECNVSRNDCKYLASFVILLVIFVVTTILILDAPIMKR